MALVQKCERVQCDGTSTLCVEKEKVQCDGTGTKKCDDTYLHLKEKYSVMALVHGVLKKKNVQCNKKCDGTCLHLKRYSVMTLVHCGKKRKYSVMVLVHKSVIILICI